MTLRSMTGFGQAAGAAAGYRWQWDIRSVNGRGLDVRLRLPQGFEALELKAREAVARRLARGSVAVGLTVQREGGAGEVRLNETALTSVLAAVAKLRATGDFDRPRPEGILAIKGVLEAVDSTEDEAAVARRTRAMLDDLDKALERLAEARAEEGARLKPIVESQLASIEAMVVRISALPSRQPAEIRRRLEEQLNRLLEAAPALDPSRLHQEAAILATKADVEEELVRLRAHIAAARDLLSSDEPVGRKFDFLSQEFNREANTVCSKSNDVEVTRVGLELKATIDQMREQVQNIE